MAVAVALATSEEWAAHPEQARATEVRSGVKTGLLKINGASHACTASAAIFTILDVAGCVWRWMCGAVESWCPADS